MKRFTSLLAALLGIFTIHGAATAQLGDRETPPTPEPDERIRRQLDALDLKYEITSSGSFKLTFNMGEGEDGKVRSQIVIVNSKTEKVESLEIREVWSPAYKSRGMLPQDVANRLLENSFSQKIGAWQVITSEDAHMATYAAKISANADAQTLKLIISAAASTADLMEQKITTGDEF